MSYQLTLHRKPAYLHAIVTGDNTRENVAGYLQDIRRECLARGCRRVLVEERLEGARLGTSDVVAIVAENVALRRGIPVRLFGAVAEAEKWLEDPWRR
jgi:hypothetical protein